jgi:hypothetical protein
MDARINYIPISIIICRKQKFDHVLTRYRTQHETLEVFTAVKIQIEVLCVADSLPQHCTASQQRGPRLELKINVINIYIYIYEVKLYLCLTKHHAIKTYWLGGSIPPPIIGLGIRWRWVVSFTPQPLYPRGKRPWYPLDRRLGGPQSRSGRGGEEKNSQPLLEIEP